MQLTALPDTTLLLPVNQDDALPKVGRRAHECAAGNHQQLCGCIQFSMPPAGSLCSRPHLPPSHVTPFLHSQISCPLHLNFACHDSGTFMHVDRATLTAKMSSNNSVLNQWWILSLFRSITCTALAIASLLVLSSLNPIVDDGESWAGQKNMTFILLTQSSLHIICNMRLFLVGFLTIALGPACFRADQHSFPSCHMRPQPSWHPR